ncbi:MAG: sugar phosphate isomerase/epimerase [Armatimonadetes bacterium]|nr:sugar phosphate isomerase/epimerase [Armatimonadota bacterium]
MKIGMNVLLWTAAAQEEHLPLLEAIKGWGYDGLEFPMFSPDCSPWKTLACKLDDLGLGRTVVTIVSPQANPISDDPSIRRAGLNYLKACIDSCEVLGATFLVGPLYSPCGALVGRGRTETEWAWGIESLRAAAEYASTAGICLTIEALNRFETYFLNSAEDAARFVDEVDHPNLRMMFDTFHANIEEKDPVEAIKTAGKRIAHFHVSENDRSTPGEGHVPWVGTFSALKEIGYEGWLTVEAFGRAMPEVAAATCIWRDMFPSEEHLARNARAFISRWL